jgi:hypothetical protein
MTSNAARAATLVRALQAGVHGDRGTLEAVLTADVRAWTPRLATTSLGELLAELDQRDGLYADVELDVAPLDVGGDYACVEWTVELTPQGVLTAAEHAGDRSDDAAASASRVALHGVTVAEFHGERICALRQYWDELDVLDQLGAPVDALPSEPGASS